MDLEGRILQMMRDGVPSKRANKNRSGRSGRKQFQSAQSVRRAGGLGVVAAMLEGPEGIFRELCVVVPQNRGYVEGRIYRDPNLGQRSSGAQRGQ
jgi:hypothetical protein